MRTITLDTNDPRQVKQFLDLPFRLYAGVPQWVPPLAPDARRTLDRRRNPFFRHSEAAFLLALDDHGRAIGRLAVMDHTGYNNFTGEHTAFFGLFECEADAIAAGALFEAACAWAMARGLNKLVGPRGFSVMDGLGMLVRGFEHRPAFGIPYNLPYYPGLVEAAGFTAAGEIVSGHLDAGMPFPEKVHALAEVVKQRRKLRVEQCQSRRDLRRLIPSLQKLYNASLGQMDGGAPLSDAEVQAMADQMLWFADPRLIKIVVKEPAGPGAAAEPVGFVLAYPDISAAVQRTRGRLFPLGWLHLLLELRRTRWVNVNGAGILPHYRGLGGTALLFSELARSIIDAGYQHADIVQIGIENEKMQREMRAFGIDFYKTHRMYQRALP